MKLYLPESVTTTAQADALPAGTLVLLSRLSDSWTRLLAPEDRDSHSEDEVPFLALVPTEAEVQEMHYPCADSGDPFIRYFTPWQRKKESA